jgi:spore coat protein U-like protein
MFSTKSLRLAIVAAAAVLSCPLAMADSQNINISATVSGNCKLTSFPNMTFTPLDPSSAANGTGSTTISYKCTKGTAPTAFTVGGSASPYNGTLTGALASPDTIAYSVSWTAPTTAGTGFGAGSTATDVTLTGTILNANYVNVKADTYSQTVSVAITP